MKYPFVVIEGSDGSGKSSLRKMIYSNLVDKKHECLTVGKHSWLNPKYTEIIVNTRNGYKKYTKEVIAEAYAQDKKIHSEITIKKHLKQRFVVADRFTISDMVYLNILHDIPIDYTYSLQQKLGIITPDLIVYVETNPKTAYKRIKNREESRSPYGWPSKQDFWETEETIRLIQSKYCEILNSKDYNLPKIIKINNDYSFEHLQESAKKVSEYIQNIILSSEML